MNSKELNRINENVERQVKEEQIKALVLDGFFNTFRDKNFALEELIQYCDEMGYETIDDLVNDRIYAE